MITLVLVKNPFSPRDGREIKKIEYAGTLAELLEENKIEGADMLATVNGKTVATETEICDGDFIVIYPAVAKGGGKGKSLLGILAAVVLSVVSFGVGGYLATGTWGSFAGASAMAATGGYLAAAAIMFLGSSLIGRMTGQKADNGSGYGSEATYSWNGVSTMEGQNNSVALTYGVVKSGGQTIAKYTMAQGDNDYLYWLVSAGEGEVEISDIKLNNNAIGMYKDVSYQTRQGTNDQSIIPYFGDTHYTLALNYNMDELNTWYSAQAQGNSTQGLIIKVELPNGLAHTSSKGKLKENWIAIQIEVKQGSGSWVSYNSFAGADMTDWDSSKNALVIKGKSTKAIRKEYRIDRIPADEYAVRVRVTAIKEDNVQKDIFTIYWTGVSSIIYDDFSYPCTALLGIKAKATGQLSGSPTLTFKKVRGSIYAYNPTAGAYQQKPANNPAWACYDLLHQCRYLKNINTGNYQYEVRGVPRNLMRYDDFAAWASYCDTKHFNVNIEIVSAGEMLDVANEKIAPIGHGRVVRFGTKYGCIFSHPQQAVQMFGMGNIVEGSFHEEFLKLSDRANCVEVTYTNEAADYERDVITIYSDTYDTDPYQKSAQVTMDGCVKYSQAYREGVYQLLCNKLQLRTVSFEADIDAIACTVGDVVIISHDVPKWQSSGRIESVSGNTVVLPCEVGDLSATYVFQWRRSSTDVLYEKNCTIVSSADGWTTATISGDTVTTISAGDIFSIAETGTEDKLFTVQSITRSQDFRRSVSCIEYNDDVFEEPSNYDPDESRETLYSVMFGQMANELITVTARRGVKTETYTTSFTKQENGWYLDVEINETTSGYSCGGIVINGTNYGTFGVTNLPLNKDYLITAMPAIVGVKVYLNGNVNAPYWGQMFYRLYYNHACTDEVVKRGDLQGRVRVIDISGGSPASGEGIFGNANSQNIEWDYSLSRATEIDQNVDVSGKTTLSHACNNCHYLVSIDLSNWNPISTISVESMFTDDGELRDIGDISNWIMPEVLNASHMFQGCGSLVSIDLHNWATPKLTNVESMFEGCGVMRVVDISGINTTNVTNANRMLYNCVSMEYIIMDSSEIKFSGNVVMPTPNATCKYLVPANMVASYKAHANWSSRADLIDSIDNYTIVRSNGHVTVSGG